MTLVYVLAGILLMAIGLLGLIDLVQRIRQRVRVYRVGKELRSLERDAYRAYRGQGPRIVRGQSRSEWEGDA